MRKINKNIKKICMLFSWSIIFMVVNYEPNISHFIDYSINNCVNYLHEIYIKNNYDIIIFIVASLAMCLKIVNILILFVLVSYLLLYILLRFFDKENNLNINIILYTCLWLALEFLMLQEGYSMYKKYGSRDYIVMVSLYSLCLAAILWITYFLSCKNILKKYEIKLSIDLFLIKFIRSIIISVISWALVITNLYGVSDNNKQLYILYTMLTTLFTLYYPYLDAYEHIYDKIHKCGEDKEN